jgi:glutathione synthase/RimK-type ligase-like ATP-grasp enzyme
MIKDKNGKYIFLEINPNGQWAWIEMETGLKISEAIIDYLKPTE